MARKRVNKNLVAFLTVMGILLTAVVVMIAISLGADRDPKIWADQARDRLKNEEYQVAAELFQRAYKKSKDVKYLVEAARCCYQGGDPGLALQVLKTAQSASEMGAPGHKEAVKTWLVYAWELKRPGAYWQLDPTWRTNLLDFAQDMERCDEQDVMGSISEAVARLAMAADDPQQRVQGDAALQRAISINENDPCVVLTRIQRERQQTNERLAQLAQDRAAGPEREKLNADFSQHRVALLKAGVEANPTDWTLIAEYVGALQEQNNPAAARQVLERALAQAPDAAQIQAGLADFLVWQALQERAKLSPEEYAKLLDDAAEHSTAATRLSPGLFQAYDSQAQAVLLHGAQDLTIPIAPEYYEAALNIYKKALETTAGIRSIDAFEGAHLAQPLLHIHAFMTAAQFFDSAKSASEREQRLQWLKQFRQAAEDRYPDAAFTWYIRGLACLAQNDASNAIQAFENADRVGKASALSPLLWIRVGGLPVHKLAVLYRARNEPGMSLKLTEEALREYAEVQPGRLPPLDLCVNRAELLNTLNRSQEALDYIKQVRNEYAAALNSSLSNRERLSAAEAVALSMTKRGGEAAKALENADSAAGLLMQAELAGLSQDRETEMARLQEVLAAADVEPKQVVSALELLVPLLGDQEQRERVRQGLPPLRERFADNAPLLRRLDQYDAVLASANQEELDGKLLELIAAEPAGTQRTRQYFDFYATRGQYAEAQKYLDEMEAADPEDTAVLGNQFTLALRMKDFKLAEQYVAKLAHANDGMGADNAGGAVFRGQLALERNQAEDAVREYRAAQARLPRSSSLQVQLGQALLAANRVDEALDALREACDLNPNNFAANALLDETYYKRVTAERRPEDWEKYLEQAARLRPRHPYVVENADRVDPQAGIKLREQRRTAQPQDVDNLIRLAQLYADKKVGDLDHAAERFQEAARLAPGNIDVARAAAQFLGKQGNRSEGEKLIAACLDKQSGVDRVSVQVLLAKFYNLLGDTAAAEQAFAAARQMAMDLPQESGKRNDALLGVELELVNFYRGLPGRARDTITTARWVLDKLNAKDAQDLPRLRFTRQAIILALLESKQLGEAEKEIKGYVETFSEDATVALFEAQLKLAQRQWQDAYAALTRVLQNAPNHSGALLQRGGLATHLGMSREAVADLTKARDLTKAAFERVPAEKRAQSNEARLFAETCGALATVYESEEQYELGESTLREMIDVLSQGSGPEYEGKQRGAVTRLLRLYERWGRPDKAQQLISEFMARDAKDPFWPLQLAQVRQRQAEKCTEQADAAAKLDSRTDEKKYRAEAESAYLAAARYYENAEQLAAGQKLPGHLNYVAYELDALTAAGRGDRALELFRNVEARAGAKVPAIIYAAMIRVYEASDQRPQALAVLERAVVGAYLEGGGAVPAVMGFAGEFLPPDEVAGVIRKLIEKVNPDSRESFQLHNLLATQLLKMNQPAEVLTTLEPVLAKAPPNSVERLAAMMGRQQALMASGQLDAALALLEEICRANPDNALVLNNLAYLLVDQANRPAEALPYAERARELNGSDPSVLDTVGWVYVRNGRNEQAEAALKEALAQDPNSAAANYHLGVLYQAMGRMAAARAALQRAIEYAAKDKNEDIQQKAEEALKSLQ